MTSGGLTSALEVC